MRRILSVLIVSLLVVVPPVIAEWEDTSQVGLPSSFCWRDMNGTDYTTTIKNQAPAPTCEAYGLVAALETLMQYQEQELFTPDLSETHLYFYAGGTYEAGYVNLVDAANYLKETGVPDEGCYPDPHRPFDYPFESISGWENRTVKIQEWGWVDVTEDAIKTALIEHGPLIVCMHFWQDFYYYMGGIYEHRWGGLAGGHVMALMGYDDSDDCWIIKNSWGTGWGEDGWLRTSYDADMFADWYGEDTGVMYVGGVYGNFKPDVPKVQISQPEIYYTYLFGHQLPTIFRDIPLIQEAAPRIVGDMTVTVQTENAELVEFYLDNELVHVDEEAPFTWDLTASFGIHTVKALASNGEYQSQDIRDVFIIS
jgi:hypothetical protein